MKDTMNSMPMGIDLGNLEMVSGGTGDTTVKQAKFKVGDRVFLKGYGEEEIYVHDVQYKEEGYIYLIMSLRHGFGLAHDEDLSDRPFS